MQQWTPLIGVAIATGLSAGLKWLGKQSASPWHKWVIPFVPAVLTVLRTVLTPLGVAVPDGLLEGGIAASGAMSLHQLYQGVKEATAEKK